MLSVYIYIDLLLSGHRNTPGQGIYFNVLPGGAANQKLQARLIQPVTLFFTFLIYVILIVVFSLLGFG